MGKKVLLAAGLVLLIGAGAAVSTIGPRNIIGLLTYGRQVREGNLRVGDRAPLIPLVSLDGVTSRSLGGWIGPRPLVLVFGSFT